VIFFIGVETLPLDPKKGIVRWANGARIRCIGDDVPWFNIVSSQVNSLFSDPDKLLKLPIRRPSMLEKLSILDLNKCLKK
jgi:hypothetical protein